MVAVAHAVARIESRLVVELVDRRRACVLWERAYTVLESVMCPDGPRYHPGVFVAGLDYMVRDGLRTLGDEVVAVPRVIDAYLRRTLGRTGYVPRGDLDGAHHDARFGDWATRIVCGPGVPTAHHPERRWLVRRFDGVLRSVLDIARDRGLVVICIFVETCLPAALLASGRRVGAP